MKYREQEELNHHNSNNNNNNNNINNNQNKNKRRNEQNPKKRGGGVSDRVLDEWERALFNSSFYHIYQTIMQSVLPAEYKCYLHDRLIEFNFI